MSENVDLTDATLANELGIGCLKMKRAHLWPLSHYFWESSAKQAIKQLRLKKRDDAKRILEKIEKEIEIIRGQKTLKKDQRIESATELGYLVGHVFCQGQNWEWCVVSAPKEVDSICICNANRSLTIEPIAWIYKLLTKNVPVKCLLTYNMIDAGRLPPVRPNSYTRLN